MLLLKILHKKLQRIALYRLTPKVPQSYGCFGCPIG
jgi:hypothetical protein